VLGYGLYHGGSRFRFPAGAGNFSLHHRVQNGSGPNQTPIQWVPGAISLGVKRPGREAHHALPSNAELNNAWRYTSTPHYVFMAWCLVNHRDSFTFFTFPLTRTRGEEHTHRLHRYHRQDNNWPTFEHTGVYPKVFVLAAWSDNCK
jgi:hypothetical protein